MRYVFMRYPEGRTKALTFSYDDGMRQDRQLAELFDKYSLKATFNLNGACLREENYSAEQLREIFLSKGHEIAVHGQMHRANGCLRPIEGIREVLECRMELEKKCGRIIRGMAYPDSGIRTFANGCTYEQVKQYLQELDIAYARTLGEDNDAFMLPTDFHAWMPSAHHNNPKIMEYIDSFLALDLSLGAMSLARRYPRLLYIWGHAYEFERNNNWEHMECICQTLANRDDIWYATNMEIYEYVQAYNHLQYSADGVMVYNPSLMTVWMDADGKLFEIPSGKTVMLE